MGADGHITLYSLDKLNKKYGEEYTGLFTTFITDSLTYIQEFPESSGNNHRVLSSYFGDNIWTDSTLDRVEEHIKLVKYNIYPKQETSGLQTEDLKYLKEIGLTQHLLLEMGEYLVNECRLTQWEVWT